MNDEGKCDLAKLWWAIYDNTKGDAFWLGEILLNELQKETGFPKEPGMPARPNGSPAQRKADSVLADLLLNCTSIEVCTVDYATKQHVRHHLSDEQRAAVAVAVNDFHAEGGNASIADGLREIISALDPFCHVSTPLAVVQKQAEQLLARCSSPAAKGDDEVSQLQDIIFRCMDMLADVPGDTLEDRLTRYVGSHMELQLRSQPENVDWKAGYERAVEEIKELRADLNRATAVIADQFGAGHPAVKETAEELAQWAEEFTDRYFSLASTERTDG